MDIRTFISAMAPDERARFAARAGTTRGHLQNVGYGLKSCSPELSAAIERESGGAVTRRELRPNDWHRIWPELAEQAAPTPEPA